ncbi:hypothetical protein BD413DRAFT_98958 [Trametes elegans]|nr:hypothetical protein BD413DRAFT_98958 [Trametes elegans]
MDDPALASEMIQLLRAELGRVKAEVQEARNSKHTPATSTDGGVVITKGASEGLYELQQENAQLKADVEAARQRLGQLHGQPDGENVPTGRTEDTQGPGATSDNTLVGDSEFRLASLANKLSRARDKYRQAKALKSELQDAISSVASQVEETMTRRYQEARKLEGLKAELEEANSKNTTEFDPLEFLRQPQPTPDGLPPGSAKGMLVSSGRAFNLSEAMTKLCVAGGYLARHAYEIVWSPAGPSSQCVMLAPAQCYNPKLNSGKGGWEPAGLERVQQGERIELFWEKKGNEWHYMGVYQHQGQLVIPQNASKGLLRTRMKKLRKRTVTDSKLVPPMLLDTVRGMYDDGVLQIVASGWRRVGFNQRLANALRSRLSSSSATHGGNNRPERGGIPLRVPTEGQRDVRPTSSKRKRGGKEGPRKKPKK